MLMTMRQPFRCLAVWSAPRCCRSMVSLHGHTVTLSPRFRMRETAGVRNVVSDEKPPNPLGLLTDPEQEEQIYRLFDWFRGKDQVLCLTGAGLSTESGIPDYRGSEGSYHKGHKPMIQYVQSGDLRLIE